MSLEKSKIVFLLLPRIHMLDLSGPEQVFLEAQDMGLPIEIIHCSNSTTITSSSGLSISGLQLYSDVATGKGDFIIIPGMEVNYLLRHPIAEKQGIASWLKQAIDRGTIICLF